MTDCIIRSVGLDVHKRVVEACIVDQSGNVVHRERFALNRRVLELFATKILQPTDQVALEATTNCWAVADALRPHVAKVAVSNPLTTKAIAQAKVKTDKVDALVLAQLLRCDFLPQVWQPDEDTRRLRELTGRRSALVGQRTAMRNRVHSVLAMRLIEEPKRLFNSEGLQWLKTVELDAQGRMLVDSDLRQLEFLQTEVAALDQELARRGHASDAVKLLMTLPGVDVGTAEALHRRLGRPHPLPRRRPRRRLPGPGTFHQTVGRALLPRPDHQRAATATRSGMLIEAAQRLDKHPGPLGVFFLRLLRKKKRNVAVVAAGAEAGPHRLADAGPRRALPLRHPKEHGNEARQAAVKVTGKRRKSGTPRPRQPQSCYPAAAAR